jgi:hypothetical protein
VCGCGLTGVARRIVDGDACPLPVAGAAFEAVEAWPDFLPRR